MRILMIAHVGQTVGHLVRCLAIAEELHALGVTPEIAASPQGKWVVEQAGTEYRYHPVDWDWSHNEIHPERPTQDYARSVVASVRQVLQVLEEVRPDLVVGCPGVFTAQAARSRGIPHVSILHGPYLSPVIDIEEPTHTEAAVIDFGRRIACGGAVDSLLARLSDQLFLPRLTYQDYLNSEPIFVPQPGLHLPEMPNLETTDFIRASIGPPVDPTVDLQGACHITFGSGNPCDISRIAELASAIFPRVVTAASSTPLACLPDNVIVQPFIASASLAGRVAAVISHGGIGTVGTFAEHGTAQLVIPTEIDQATMAVHGVKLGVTRQCGLESWASDLRLGRHLPYLDDENLKHELEQLVAHRPSLVRSSAGATMIAEALLEIYG